MREMMERTKWEENKKESKEKRKKRRTKMKPWGRAPTLPAPNGPDHVKDLRVKGDTRTDDR
jgi:hypothetical protein